MYPSGQIAEALIVVQSQQGTFAEEIERLGILRHSQHSQHGIAGQITPLAFDFLIHPYRHVAIDRSYQLEAVQLVEAFGTGDLGQGQFVGLGQHLFGDIFLIPVTASLGIFQRQQPGMYLALKRFVVDRT